MRKFSLRKDYYEEGAQIFKKSRIQINPGITVLVGCNGYGKTTLLKIIESKLEKDRIPCIRFDNLSEGGAYAREKAAAQQNFQFLATAMGSSEGENICLNILEFARKIGTFIRDPSESHEINPIAEALRRAGENSGEKETEAQSEVSNERWILLDAVDSGLSLDNIADLRNFFDLVLRECPNLDVYIILSANSYGFADGANCFDPYAGKYLKFDSYKEYRDYILETRKIKDTRGQELETEEKKERSKS